MNYGSDRIRFIRPVPAGSRIQASATLTSVEETPLGVRAVISVEVRLDDGGKPACIARPDHAAHPLGARTPALPQRRRLRSRLPSHASCTSTVITDSSAAATTALSSTGSRSGAGRR